MEIHFETEGIEPVPNSVNSDVPMKVGEIVYHQNQKHHRHYKVIETKYVADDCTGQFYQRVSLQTEE